MLAQKLAAFGLEVKIIDGHNWDEIFAALTAPAGDKPLAIVAKTVKGWGVTELQKHTYHGKPLVENQIDAAMADLDAKAAELGVAEGQDVSAAHWSRRRRLPRALTRTDLRRAASREAMAAAGMDKALTDQEAIHPPGVRGGAGGPGRPIPRSSPWTAT